MERSGLGLNWMEAMEQTQCSPHVPTSNHIQSLLSVSSINFYDSFVISKKYWILKAELRSVGMVFFFTQIPNHDSLRWTHRAFALKWFTWHWLCIWNFSYRACALTQINNSYSSTTMHSIHLKRCGPRVATNELLLLFIYLYGNSIVGNEVDCWHFTSFDIIIRILETICNKSVGPWVVIGS